MVALRIAEPRDEVPQVEPQNRPVVADQIQRPGRGDPHVVERSRVVAHHQGRACRGTQDLHVPPDLERDGPQLEIHVRAVQIDPRFVIMVPRVDANARERRDPAAIPGRRVHLQAEAGARAARAAFLVLARQSDHARDVARAHVRRIGTVVLVDEAAPERRQRQRPEPGAGRLGRQKLRLWRHPGCCQQAQHFRLRQRPRPAQIGGQLPLRPELGQLRIHRILERNGGSGPRRRGGAREEHAREPRHGTADHGSLRSPASRARSYLRTNGHHIASAMPRLTN